MKPLLAQALYAVLYYVAILIVVRLAGKRLAGQTTTFDLIVLIGLAVVLQNVALGDGPARAAIFVTVVFLCHRGLAAACSRWTGLRHLLRGAPRRLIEHGEILHRALAEESMSEEELLAGLRKLGFGSVEEVDLAVLEETGHISAVAKSKG